MRKSRLFLLFIAYSSLGLALTLLEAAYRGRQADLSLGGARQLVAELGLSDLALFTEARYTRHLSQSDRHAPFQDHPLALEHFPSGSLVMPPDNPEP
jgi:hypothetical protein